MRRLFLVLALLSPAPAVAQAIVLSACGTGNYTAAIGQLHQLTMNPAGYLCVSTTTTAATDVQNAPKPPATPPEPKK